jgi:hypothetical protein
VHIERRRMQPPVDDGATGTVSAHVQGKVSDVFLPAAFVTTFHHASTATWLASIGGICQKRRSADLGQQPPVQRRRRQLRDGSRRRRLLSAQRRQPGTEGRNSSGVRACDQSVH